jgi:hypothetical protein
MTPVSSIMDERDEQIAKAIREEIAKVTRDRENLGYLIGSPEDSYIQGEIVGLRRALAFVDPAPHI